MQDEPHESEKYLVKWAKAKADDFYARTTRYFEVDKLYTTIVEPDPETGKNLYIIRFTGDLPWELRGIASDAIKALRDALDQACLHATQRLIPKLKGKGTHFPFGENPDDLDKVLSGECGRQSKDIAPELHSVLRNFEPYPTGNGYTGGNDRLRALGRVSGPNKHETTLRLAGSVGSNVARLESSGGLRIRAPNWDRAKNEIVLFEVPQKANLEFDLDVEISVEFDNPWLGGAPAPRVLHMIADIVENVIARLEAEATPPALGQTQFRPTLSRNSMAVPSTSGCVSV